MYASKQASHCFAKHNIAAIAFFTRGSSHILWTDWLTQLRPVTNSFSFSKLLLEHHLKIKKERNLGVYKPTHKLNIKVGTSSPEYWWHINIQNCICPTNNLLKDSWLLLTFLHECVLCPQGAQITTPRGIHTKNFNLLHQCRGRKSTITNTTPSDPIAEEFRERHTIILYFLLLRAPGIHISHSPKKEEGRGWGSTLHATPCADTDVGLQSLDWLQSFSGGAWPFAKHMVMGLSVTRSDREATHIWRQVIPYCWVHQDHDILLLHCSPRIRTCHDVNMF